MSAFGRDLVIRNVHLAFDDSAGGETKLYDVLIRDGKVAEVSEASWLDSDESSAGTETLDANGGLLLPSLCHAHIHLDKCYLLDRCTLVEGDFKEALQVTAEAKSRFSSNEDDIYTRGKRLILASVAAGVTSMRAHVEVDTTVQTSCLRVGQRLKTDMQHLCDVHLSVFAQDPLFPDALSTDPGENYALLRACAAQPGISAVGSAPYVEPSRAHAEANMRLVLDLAHAHALHADFHLDYTLDAAHAPLIWPLLAELRARLRAGTWRRTQRVTVGHATRLALFGGAEWARLAALVSADGLPVSLVGLPQSDVYMLGRGCAGSPPRGTLDAVRLAREHGLRAALAVNNVQNAFTPQGAPDPLALCPLGVALFHAGTRAACRALVEAVTVHAKTAIGQTGPGLVPQVGDAADFVLLHDNDGVQSAACDPSYTRTTIKAGRVVARRKGEVQFELS